MKVEKKSLQRFLLIYILSSLALLASGLWFYYKMNSQLIVVNHTKEIKQNIENFINLNQKNHFLRTSNMPKYLDKPIAIYINEEYKTGSFNLKNINFDKTYYIENGKLYYLHNEHKRWGNIYFVSYVDISNDLTHLRENLFLFFLFSTFFITIIAFVLGKVFLKPMRQTIESLEDFIADATHEINTPISNILINIELAKELYPKCTNIEEFTKIQSSAFRVSKIFKDLSYARLEHTEIKSIQNIDLKEFLDERLESFNAFIKNKHLDVVKETRKKYIDIDKEDLTRLIDNLLSNAIKYSPNNGLLEIRLDDTLELVNDGEIKNEIAILNKFSRENKNEGGFGLGLYIVQKISNSYKYKFSINSQNSKVTAKIIFN